LPRAPHRANSFEVTAYLFDFNGVLVDDERVHFAAFRDVLARRDVVLGEDRYFAEYLAFDDATAFRAMLRDAGRAHDEATVRSCIDEKLPLYLAAVERDLRLFSGAFELVRACAERGPVAIVSGALRVEIEYALRRADATGLVSTIVAAEDVTACKPDPAGYLEALARLNVSADDAVVLEDSLAGVQSGLAARCTVVAVAHSYPRDMLADSRAHLVVDRIGDLDVARLEALCAERRR
jgi:HAD superfamily hydrolase (TIGR01509 family)